jgi:hypothetical protein
MDMEDDDVYSDIPLDWWISPDSKGRLILCCMVHRKMRKSRLFALDTGVGRTEKVRGKRKRLEFRRRGITTERNEQ